MAFIDKLQQLISIKLTYDTLLDMIEKKIKTRNVTIDNVDIIPGTSKGDSYLSTICRFTIMATRLDENRKIFLPVIVKSLPKNLGRRKTFRSLDFFENEIIFYEKVWPALDSFQKSKNLPNQFNNIPLLLYTYLDETDGFIALENLKYDNYEAAPRGDGLDIQHIHIVLRLFASFHGLAIAFKDQKPDEFEKAALSLKETYFDNKYRKWYHNYQQSLFKVAEDSIAKELPKKYMEKFKQLISNDFYGTLCNYCKAHDGLLSAITHGDAWIPNFLFKYNEDRYPQYVKLIDFQLTRYASLANDLTFFLYTCASTNVYNYYWDELIIFYHFNLSETIEYLGSNKNLISLNDLKNEIIKCIRFGIGMSMEALTMSLLDDEDIPDLDSIEGDEEIPLESIWIIKPFKTKEKRQKFVAMFKHAIDSNFI